MWLDAAEAMWGVERALDGMSPGLAGASDVGAQLLASDSSMIPALRVFAEALARLPDELKVVLTGALDRMRDEAER